MTLEEFRNLAQGIQAIFIAIAAIIASGWAIYTFRSLLSVKKAEAELTKIHTEIDKIKLEQIKVQNELKDTPMVLAEIKPFLLGSIEENNLCIHIKLRVQNTGNTPEHFGWGDSSVKAALVENIGDDHLDLSKTILGILGRITGNFDGVALWPGEEIFEEFLIPVRQHGIYVIFVSIIVSPESVYKIQSIVPHNLDSTGFGTSAFFDTRENT
jgi:hypothetical protein